MRSLRTVLVNDFGLDLTGWTLGTADGISADGLVIVGAGIRLGRAEAWIANLRADSTQSDPLLPGGVSPGLFTFTDVPSGVWVDPPTAFGFHYVAASGSLFTSILDFPMGFAGPFTVSTGGNLLGSFGPGNSVDFTPFSGGGVSEFTITGINPLVDPSDPTAFPLQLSFNAPTGSFTMQALQSQQVVPEPSTWLLLATGLIGLLGLGWRKRQQAA